MYIYLNVIERNYVLSVIGDIVRSEGNSKFSKLQRLSKYPEMSLAWATGGFLAVR